MNVMLHGATDRGSTNFGDFLYGNELYRICSDCAPEAKVCYYNESDFFKTYTTGYQTEKFKIRDSDLLVYIPGGYFTEPCQATLKRRLINFRRYMPFGLAGLFYKKAIAIVGLGAGNIHTPFLKWPLRWILKRAALVTVRDDISRNELLRFKPKAGVENYGDMILSIDMMSLAQSTSRTQAIGQKADELGKKILVVHYNHSAEALALFADTLQQFRSLHPEYLFVVASDSVIEKDEELFARFQTMLSGDCVHYSYSNPFELIELLNLSDLVLTCKLHLGVVSCMLGKSVVSAAEDYRKTSRFYDQIEQSGRCVPLCEAKAQDLAERMARYCGQSITIPPQLRRNACKHRELLISCVQKIGNQNQSGEK